MTHSFPTRRSSDLGGANEFVGIVAVPVDAAADPCRLHGQVGEMHHHVRRAEQGGDQFHQPGRNQEGQQIGTEVRHIADDEGSRSEEHTSELQSLMRISYAVFCVKKKTKNTQKTINHKKRKEYDKIHHSKTTKNKNIMNTTYNATLQFKKQRATTPTDQQHNTYTYELNTTLNIKVPTSYCT